MPSMKLIKRRIESVGNTQQIMKAMDLVATSQLQKAKTRLATIRPMFAETKRIMQGIELDEETSENLFVMPRKVKRAAYILITSDRGFCGGYNINVSKQAFTKVCEDNGREVGERLVTVGMKGWDYFRRRGKNIAKRYKAVSEAVTYPEAEQIGKLVMDMFASNDEAEGVQEVYIVYTRFESMMTHVPVVERILPLYGGGADRKSGEFMAYEPEAASFLAEAIPMYVNIFVYGAMVESAACEYAARMMSMEAAAHNAEEIIEDLTLDYNRKRQGIITQEINEIVSGANALQ